jgi:hypothetical protein
MTSEERAQNERNDNYQTAPTIILRDPLQIFEVVPGRK